MKWSSDFLLLKEFLSTSNDLLGTLIKLISNDIGPQKNTVFDDNSQVRNHPQTQMCVINKRKAKPQVKAEKKKKNAQAEKQVMKRKNWESIAIPQ